MLFQFYKRSSSQRKRSPEIPSGRERFSPWSMLRQRTCPQDAFALDIPKRSSPPMRAARSSLEKYILLAARAKAGEIQAVVLEFDSSGRGEGTNWRVSGIATGRVERDAAHRAVASAARRHSAWIMVEDGNPLDGQPLEERSGRPAIGSAAAARRPAA